MIIRICINWKLQITNFKKQQERNKGVNNTQKYYTKKTG